MNQQTLSPDTRPINWPVTLFIVGYHVALLVALPLYFMNTTPSWQLVTLSVALLFLTEIGIGGAYHRFYSHRCYRLAKPAEFVLLTLATLATQGSALRWSFEHRLHHQYVDTDGDPYNINRGFWYAHILWLFRKGKPVDPKRVSDLMQNRLVVFQDRYFPILSIGGNLLLALLVGAWLGEIGGAILLLWWTRLAVSHHLTWFVNSLAHSWGERTYSKEHSAVDNYILAFLTVGEGYHNYHHTFAADYRNGVRWYHFDPTKWTIFLLSKLGLASGLRRYNETRIKTRLLHADKRLLLGRLTERAADFRVELEAHVERIAAKLEEQLTEMARLANERRGLQRRGREGSRRRRLTSELRRIRRNMREDWRTWYELSSAILSDRWAAAAAAA